MLRGDPHAGRPTKAKRPPDVQKANKAFDETTLAICKHRLPTDFGARTCDPSVIRFRDVPSEEMPMQPMFGI